VPVTIGYKRREIEVLLLLDTGASVITLHKDVADRLALPSGHRTSLIAAGGRKIDAGLVQLGSVKFGPYHRSNLVAAVIKNRGTSVDYHGLLGMNALRGVDFRIDHAGQLIHWGS
jgi:predicted aspartyl protease